MDSRLFEDIKELLRVRIITYKIRGRKKIIRFKKKGNEI